jgi:hypothetical protein
MSASTEAEGKEDVGLNTLIHLPPQLHHRSGHRVDEGYTGSDTSNPLAGAARDRHVSHDGHFFRLGLERRQASHPVLLYALSFCLRMVMRSPLLFSVKHKQSAVYSPNQASG